MNATDVNDGDLALVKDVALSALQVGDVLVYKSTNNENDGEVAAGKIQKLTVDEQENPGFLISTSANQVVILLCPIILFWKNTRPSWRE